VPWSVALIQIMIFSHIPFIELTGRLRISNRTARFGVALTFDGPLNLREYLLLIFFEKVTKS
jgi:hypothetical protein